MSGWDCSEKRARVVSRHEIGHQFGGWDPILPPLGEVTPALPTVGAWLMYKSSFAPSLKTRQDREWLFLSPKQPKGSKLKTLKKIRQDKVMEMYTLGNNPALGRDFTGQAIWESRLKAATLSLTHPIVLLSQSSLCIQDHTLLRFSKNRDMTWSRWSSNRARCWQVKSFKSFPICKVEGGGVYCARFGFGVAGFCLFGFGFFWLLLLVGLGFFCLVFGFLLFFFSR